MEGIIYLLDQAGKALAQANQDMTHLRSQLETITAERDELLKKVPSSNGARAKEPVGT